MKFLSDLLVYIRHNITSLRNVIQLQHFFMVLAVFVTLSSFLFHLFMAQEGRSYSWLTGLYWTLTVMSTLGLGDITFTSDAGRLFTMVILVSGVGFFLILLPFLFMEGQSAARVPRELPTDISGHIILTHDDPVSRTLINRLTHYGYPYVLLASDLSEALHLHDLGLKVMMGEIDNPSTFLNAQVGNAALVATTASNAVNANVAFTVRDLCETVQIIATASDEAAVDILKLAGCSHVLRLGNTLGQSLARRVSGGDAVTHVIGRFDQLFIAEATAAGTPLVGTTLRQSRLREQVGISLIGVWERGRFATAGPETLIGPHTVLVLAGSLAQLQKYDAQFGMYNVSDQPVIILGGGRVGRATGQALLERKVDYRIVEQRPDRMRDPHQYIIGNAAERDVLESASIMQAPTVVITTHDDDINIYLTIYCRRLRPDIQIISRATLEKNIPTLHRAGADFVMSYASMGANAIFNLLERSDVLMVTEGLNVFKVSLPPALAGKTIYETAIRQVTGCTVIALQEADGLYINPDPGVPLATDAEMILIGTAEGERQFLQRFGKF
jgi:Trk K+ transport system NAD-binding subunit